MDLLFALSADRMCVGYIGTFSKMVLDRIMVYHEFSCLHTNDKIEVLKLAEI